MRRADRLFLIIHALRGRRTALPAKDLADQLGVSTRTVYRDVADLQASGVPVEGEAGIGYMLRQGSDIPPLMFTREELEALIVGTRFVRAFTGDQLTTGAEAALLKIQAVLPDALRTQADRTRIFAPVWEGKSDRNQQLLDQLHKAIGEHQVLRLTYRDLAEQETRRDIEPLCLAFWGGAWCHLRNDFRNFRPDRITAWEHAGETFTETEGRDFAAYLASVKA